LSVFFYLQSSVFSLNTFFYQPENGSAIKEGFAKMDKRTMEIVKLIEKLSQQVEKIPDKTAYLLK
jgi:hypothetical protein